MAENWKHYTTGEKEIYTDGEGIEWLRCVTSKIGGIEIVETREAITYRMVIPGFSRGTDMVRVYKPGYVQHVAEVTWSSTGALSVELSRNFAFALQHAVMTAQAINDEIAKEGQE